MKVKDLWDWAKAFGFGFSVVLAIIFFPLYLFFSLVFHKVMVEELLEFLLDED